MMEIKILCPRWGQEEKSLAAFLDDALQAGYDGVDMPLPDNAQERKLLRQFIERHNACLVIQQHQAQGADFRRFKDSFVGCLQRSAEVHPLWINSHTGRDYFPFKQNLELIDAAHGVSGQTGVEVLHEIHRGRFTYSPATTASYFDARNDWHLTADLSHWVCVSESFLEGFADVLSEAIVRTRHVHARVGFEQGPQVSDPRAPEWQYALDHFFSWWDLIVEARIRQGAEQLTFTPEFGPPPYLPTLPYSRKPVASAQQINAHMKDLLRARYGKP